MPIKARAAKGGRKTVCISSQAGCVMNCAFCATGQGGFFRNLTTEEMLDQVLYFCRILKKQGERMNNIVFMGMGEPFNNYDNVIAAIKLFNGAEYLNIGMRHISVSTCGIVRELRNSPMKIFRRIWPFHFTRRLMKSEAGLCRSIMLSRLKNYCKRWIIILKRPIAK